MSEVRTLNVGKDLKGMTVLKTDTGEKMGQISDAIIHPVEGRLVGIVVRTPEGQERALATEYLLIGKDAVMATERAQFMENSLDGSPENGIPALGEVVGTNIVTEDGKLLGRVSEVHISLDVPRTAYRVNESTLQRFLGGGFLMAGDVPHAYSRDGVRMIVPEGAEERFAVGTFEEAFSTEPQGARRRMAG